MATILYLDYMYVYSILTLCRCNCKRKFIFEKEFAHYILFVDITAIYYKCLTLNSFPY